MDEVGDEEQKIGENTAALLNARIDTLVAIWDDDDEYAAIKSALKNWQEKAGWTQALDDAAAKSRKIWACLILMVNQMPILCDSNLA